MELETHLRLARLLRYLDEMNERELLGQANEVGRMLNGLIAALNAKRGQTGP